MNIIRMYKNLLNKRPLITNMISTGVLAASGDALAQTIIEKKSWYTFDSRRSIKFFCIGVVLTGPTLAVWYKLLEKVQIRSQYNVTPFVRMIIDQALFAPVFIGVFLTVLRMCDGGSLTAAAHQLKRDMPTIYKTNLKVWPATQLVNFYLIPLQYRVLAVQFVALFWNMYLCHATEGVKHEQFDKEVAMETVEKVAHLVAHGEPELDVILD